MKNRIIMFGNIIALLLIMGVVGEVELNGFDLYHVPLTLIPCGWLTLYFLANRDRD